MTHSRHSSAERSWFAGLMMSGKITNEDYSVYLKQQYECYNALESRFQSIGDLIECLPEGLNRTDSINADM